MRKIFSFILLAFACLAARAVTWEQIVSSGEYYYGEGTAATEAEADRAALADMASKIATHVSGTFMHVDNMTMTNGNLDQTTLATNCVNTYTQSTLTETERWPTMGKAPNITVRRYMRKSELSRLFEGRKQRIHTMVQNGDEFLASGHVGMALNSYYRAYALTCSVQYPNEVRDASGRTLIDVLTRKIESILSDIKVSYDSRNDEFINLLFTYKGRPIPYIEFSYNDGKDDCNAKATDGMAMIEPAQGHYDKEVFNIYVTYCNPLQDSGDAEMTSVLTTLPLKNFPTAKKTIKAKPMEQAKTPEPPAKPAAADPQAKPTYAAPTITPPTNQARPKADALESMMAKPMFEIAATPDMLASDTDEIAARLDRVLTAINKRQTASVANLENFTANGLDVFNRLIGYGKGRVVGQPNIKYFKSAGGATVARGLQMSFSFTKGTKTTFVEDVNFTFNDENRIDNISFGLGQTTESDLLGRERPGWQPMAKEMLVEFMENYKTAYCLERLQFISDMFSDDAVIIVGHVTKRLVGQPGTKDMPISLHGEDILTSNRMKKSEYISRLRKCFAKQEFVNIRFTNSDAQRLQKFGNQEIYAVQLGQEWNSTTYADKGYLFLIIDMTDHDRPQIRVRSWQPNEIDITRVHNAGDFFKD